MESMLLKKANSRRFFKDRGIDLDFVINYLLYFADRYHVRKYGRLISGNVYYVRYEAVVIDGVMVEVDVIDLDVFSDSDIEALEFSYRYFGCYPWLELSSLACRYPEWDRCRSRLKHEKRVKMDICDFFDDPPKGMNPCYILNNVERRDGLSEFKRLLGIEKILSKSR